MAADAKRNLRATKTTQLDACDAATLMMLANMMQIARTGFLPILEENVK